MVHVLFLLDFSTTDENRHQEFLLPPESIILRLAQANRFNLAMATARSLQVDMTDLFAHLTTQCLRLSQDPDAVM
jgi:nuclear pore complex protein Nup160